MTLLNELDAQRMYKYVEDLASFGPRNPGASGDHESLRYLMRFAAEKTLYAETLPCRVMGFRAIESSIRILSYDGPRIECLPQDGSCSTPDGGIEAEVVYTGCGHDSDYEGRDVRGKMVLRISGAYTCFRRSRSPRNMARLAVSSCTATRAGRGQPGVSESGHRPYPWCACPLKTGCGCGT